MILTKSQLRGFRPSVTLSKSINDSLRGYINESKTGKVTIFLSHKHDESEELAAAINFLKGFGVEVYVDWQDEGMPVRTSGATAHRIKLKIQENKKFIFLATEGAISSKWCNWELGFGDSKKYFDHITLLPIRNDSSTFTGSEYLHIYSYIEYLDGSTRTVGGQLISAGYYVMEPADESGNHSFMPLNTWLLQ